MKWLFNYNYWIMNHKYDKEWDRTLRSLMKTEKFEQVNTFGFTRSECQEEFEPTKYLVRLGSHNLWISNYPYACFIKNMKLPSECVRPSRNTIYKLWKKLNEEIQNYSR